MLNSKKWNGGDNMSISVYADIDHNRLIIRFDYSEERVKKIRTIAGRSWNQKERYWTIPLGYESWRSFNKLFNK